MELDRCMVYALQPRRPLAVGLGDGILGGEWANPGFDPFSNPAHFPSMFEQEERDICGEDVK